MAATIGRFDWSHWRATGRLARVTTRATGPLGRDELQVMIRRFMAALQRVRDEIMRPPAEPAPETASKESSAAPASTAVEQLSVEMIELRFSITRAAAENVGHCQGGIRVLDANTVETERYRISFENAHTVRITDLETKQYTRVWGDPHVDLSTAEGVMNGEFSDLKGSADVTTFLLKDGTRIRFQAPDAGLVERIDVVRGDARVSGLGVDKRLGNVGAFHEVGSALDVCSDAGDVVSVGEDGASWYDVRGKLVWGATTPLRETPSEAASVGQS